MLILFSYSRVQAQLQKTAWGLTAQRFVHKAVDLLEAVIDTRIISTIFGSWGSWLSTWNSNLVLNLHHY